MLIFRNSHGGANADMLPGSTADHLSFQSVLFSLIIVYLALNCDRIFNVEYLLCGTVMKVGGTLYRVE